MTLSCLPRRFSELGTRDGIVKNSMLQDRRNIAGVADDIDGGGGNDVSFGKGGNDEIRGGDGDDTIYGGAGNDALSGDGGADKLYGGAGNDRIGVDRKSTRLNSSH